MRTIYAGYPAGKAGAALFAAMECGDLSPQPLQKYLAVGLLAFVNLLGGCTALRSLAGRFCGARFPVSMLFGGMDGTVISMMAAARDRAQTGAVLVVSMAIGAAGGAMAFMRARWFDRGMAMGRTE